MNSAKIESILMELTSMFDSFTLRSFHSGNRSLSALLERTARLFARPTRS